MFDETLDSSKARRIYEELCPRRDAQGVRTRSANKEREHPTEVVHLAACDIVSGMGRQPWIVHRFDCWTAF